MFCKKGVLKSFAKFTGKHLFGVYFFNKVIGGGVFRTCQTRIQNMSNIYDGTFWENN